jgi:hypothetical protein
MAQKHEVAPTASTVPKEFRETVKIGSASSWDKNILSLFHVGFERDDFADLKKFVDARYFDPPTDDEETRQSIRFLRASNGSVQPYFGSIGSRQRDRI